MRKLFPIPALACPQLAYAGMYSADAMIHLLIKLVVLGIIFWVAWWFIGYVGLPEPFNKVARAVIGLIAVVILVYALLPML